jgi:tricorn protease
VTINFDNLQQRILAVPGIAERDYAQLRAGPAGTVFFVEPLPATGTGGGGAGGGAGGGTLHRFQLSARRAAAFAQGVAQYVVSADGRKLLYRTGGAQAGLYLVEADRAVPAAGTGRLSVALRAYVDPREEFRQIFNEGWRNQRNNLYVQNMHGTDWPAMKRMYEPLLAHVMHRADLNYLMDNMGAEIAIGHSYVRGGDLPGCRMAAAPARRRLRRRGRTLSHHEDLTPAGTSCGPHWRRQALPSARATICSRSTASSCVRRTTCIACSMAPPTGRPCSR